MKTPERDTLSPRERAVSYLWARETLKLMTVFRQQFRPRFRNPEDVFQTHTPPALEIHSGFERNNHIGLKGNGIVRNNPWFFVPAYT